MPSQREQALAALHDGPLDLLVVGGGIIGASVARDAALRGLRVGLVEQRDFASGTSSRPTRLIHGGLRYLEMLDFLLVRSDMREREILLHTAPHLVAPLPFLMPLYGRGLLYRGKVMAGMQLYDALSYDKSLPRRRWLSRRETLELEPGLNPRGLQGAWRFYDAQVALVERLVIECLLDAAAHGAAIVNYAPACDFLRDASGRVVGACVQNTLTGQQLEVRARLTVNASGPWLDFTDAPLRPGKKPLLRLTKGIHLVTPSGSRHANVLFARSDGRLFFVVPWLGHSLVGTTDTDYSGDPAEAAPTDEDVRYLLAEARRAFPGSPFDQVLYTFSGVRALVRAEGVSEGRVSRKHRLLDHERREGVPGLISVVGGKITGARAIAQETVNLACRKLGHSARGQTARRPLPGGLLGDGPAVVQALGTRAARPLLQHPAGHQPVAANVGAPYPPLGQAELEELAAVYGSLASSVLGRVEANPALAERVCPHGPTIVAQLARAAEDEWAVTLADVLLRRTTLGLGTCQSLDCLPRITSRLGELVGWDAAEQARQIAAYQAEVEPMRRFSVAPCQAT